MKSLNRYIVLLGVLTISISCSLKEATKGLANQTTAANVTSPYPTINNLSVEWNILGDDNLNGIVSVEFKEKGANEWSIGMPLRRVPAGDKNNFSWKNKHAGSIFELQPDTKYEIKLILNDPDGGNAEELIEVQTRPIPQYDTNAEIIELPAGSFDLLQTKSGTKEKPVVYRGTKGKTIYKTIDLRDKKWVFIEAIQIDNLVEDGVGIKMGGSENCVVWHCIINADFGIVAYFPGAFNSYISDNILTGMGEWDPKIMGAKGHEYGATHGEGIQMTGAGNVICYNKVTGFRDCISTMEERPNTKYAGTGATEQISFDIHNNDIYMGLDDGIEADFCLSNVRVYNNRLTNCFVGLSAQPSLGGPTYFIRNAMYNIIHAAFKLKRESYGDVVLHNTVVKVGAGLGGNDAGIDYTYFRNNLAIGGLDGGGIWGGYDAGKPYGAEIRGPGPNSSFDYDAVGVVDTVYVAVIGDKPFSEVEKHGIEEIDMFKVFDNVEFPLPPTPEREAPDLRPVAGSRVVDAGIHIPNINDGFIGEAPDCGAYEAGRALPHYGPRARDNGE